jgi:hypothetical protein
VTQGEVGEVFDVLIGRGRGESEFQSVEEKYFL